MEAAGAWAAAPLTDRPPLFEIQGVLGAVSTSCFGSACVAPAAPSSFKRSAVFGKNGVGLVNTVTHGALAPHSPCHSHTHTRHLKMPGCPLFGGISLALLSSPLSHLSRSRYSYSHTKTLTQNRASESRIQKSRHQARRRPELIRLVLPTFLLVLKLRQDRVSRGGHRDLLLARGGRGGRGSRGGRG